MNHVPSQRVGPVAALPALLDELGVSHEAAFAGTGIRPDELVPDARFPYPSLVGLVEHCATVAACPHLGLLLGARNDHRALGFIGEMMASAPTLGDALRDYVGLQIGYSRGAVVYLQRSGDDTVVGYGLYDAGTALGRQIYDLVVALGCNMIRALTAGRVQPLRVLECVGSPANPAPYRSLLKTALAFDQEQTGIVIAGRDMATPLPGADPVRRLQLRTAIQAMVRGDLDDIAAQVRHALRPRLMLDEADRDAIARELDLERARWAAIWRGRAPASRRSRTRFASPLRANCWRSPACRSAVSPRPWPIRPIVRSTMLSGVGRGSPPRNGAPSGSATARTPDRRIPLSCTSLRVCLIAMIEGAGFARRCVLRQ